MHKASLHTRGPGSEAGAPPRRPESSTRGTGDELSSSSTSSSSFRGGRGSDILHGSSVRNFKLGISHTTDVCYCLEKCSCSVAAEHFGGTTLAGNILNENTCMGGKTTTVRKGHKSFERKFVTKGDQTNIIGTNRTSQGIIHNENQPNKIPDDPKQKQMSLKRDSVTS